MQPILRLAARAPRAPRRLPILSYTAQPRRFAHQDYGSEQSGMEQGKDEKNPKVGLEHPGPEAPAKKGSSSSSSSASSSSSSQTQQSSSSSSDETHGAKPAIHRPKSAAEHDDPEVKKHNEDMENRHERSVNQLSEKDNKVDKNFWSGDVGQKDAGKKSDQNSAGGQ
ncbi:hypothetical protein LTR10_016382 [Elasticomyces elasticus]|uniref:Uncharacterized protein n=1 Tax=Exophiala sideris TaxID=1016849 RepID=A0ABR0J5D1_9EURO|nr:hypothetical protein LTR10_016382 [Elasticomyces elasticus]KAK5028392.1 hypothetical protein LTS07_006483 [Exophiala sideris]KAK5035965.1 hypothetical protein LTR13_005535 [Exophiala sideris]KAK5057001.1 hypothetical protein LTR69_007639 [Exophiala sideris]KAK5181408.1 hypothetical protein LTR44_006203 [Eurotiomycetes sp. CCFEE 6388]